MYPAIQVSCEIQVELTRFHNIDLFYRGYYQLRLSVETANRDRRVQLTLDRKVEPYCEEDDDSDVKSTRRRKQCPILPACISADGLTAVSKTFLILYKQDCINLDDVFKFRLDVLQAVEEVEQHFVQSGVTLKVELFYADEDEPSEAESLEKTLKSVAHRTIKVHTDLSNGLHSYIPCTFDYYHLSTLCINVHATLHSIELPSFRITPSETSQTSSSHRRSNADVSKQNPQTQPTVVLLNDDNRGYTLANVLYDACSTQPAQNDRHKRACSRYSEFCALLLGAQESVRRQFFELKRLVPNALDVQTSSAGLAARLDAMCDAVRSVGKESELVEIVAADLKQLTAEIDVLWSHYLSIVTLNPLVTQFSAVRYQQQRVRRFAEGFLAIEYRKSLLLDPRERSLVPHEELAAMVRSSEYLEAMQAMALECVETDGLANNVPIVFEETFLEDDTATATAVSVAISSQSPTRSHVSASARDSLEPPTTERLSRRGRSATDLSQLDGVSLASALTTASDSPTDRSASKRSVASASVSSQSDHSQAACNAYADALLTAKERQRADLRRIAHASNSRGKVRQYKMKSCSTSRENLDGNKKSEVSLVGYRKLDKPMMLGSFQPPNSTSNLPRSDDADGLHCKSEALYVNNAVVIDQQTAVSALKYVLADQLGASQPRLFELKKARSRSRLDLRANDSPDSARPPSLAPGRSVWQLAEPNAFSSWLSLPDLAASACTFDQPLTVRPNVDQAHAPADVSNAQSTRDLPAETQKQSAGRKTRTGSNDVLGFLEILTSPQAYSGPNISAAEILASRSKDRHRVDYLLQFEQRTRLGSCKQPLNVPDLQPCNSPDSRSIVPAVPDKLARFVRLKEEFKRRLARVYAGRLCSDQIAVASTCPFFWAPPSSSKLLSPQPPSDPGLHLVVFVHGMDGFSHDLRSAKVALEHSLPATRFDFLMSKKNERATSHEFAVLGERLVSEILQHIDSHGAMPGRISFVGFSLGNVIIRQALTSPGLKHLVPKLHTFLSLAGPHLGVLYQTSALVNVGTWLMRKWKKSESLIQLCLKDNNDPRQTFIYRLSRSIGFELFRHVLLVSSPQDHYVPRHSARIELAGSVVRDSGELGRVYVEMLANLLSPVAASARTQLVRFDSVFALPHDTNAFIGRAAHCAVMENELFLEKFFTVSAAKYFR